MSQDSTEDLVRASYESLNLEKGGSTEEWWHEDGEFVNAREDPDHATYRGVDAIRAQAERWFEAFPDLRVEPMEIRGDGDRAFVWVHLSGHGADSGIAMDMELAQVFTLEGGRIRRIEEYFDRAEALKAVGRSEQSQENVEVSGRAAQRDLLDRLVVRFPVLVGMMAGAVLRAKPGSSLRRRLVNLQVKRGFAAMARSDVALVVLNYDPAAEVWVRGMAGVGISDCYHGHDGVRALYADIDEAFDDWKWTLRGVADGGEHMAVRGDFVGYGRGSGAETTINSGGTAVKVSDRGLILWQEWFVEQDGWTKALEAVGLSE